MRIRPAAPADIPLVAAIAGESPTAPQWTEAQFLESLQTMKGPVARLVLVLEVNGQVAGFAVVSALTAVYPVEAELESIAVAPQHRGQGYGKALLQAAEVWCRTQGATDLRLEVRSSNPAIHLYAAFGFRPTGTRRAYYTHPTEDAVCMLRTIVARTSA